MGGSATWSSKVWPATVTSPPIGHDGEDQRRAGITDRYGASLKTNRSARSGNRSSLKNSLIPSASVWSDAERPGPVGPDAALHVGDRPCARTRSSA